MYKNGRSCTWMKFSVATLDEIGIAYVHLQGLGRRRRGAMPRAPPFRTDGTNPSRTHAFGPRPGGT